MKLIRTFLSVLLTVLLGKLALSVAAQSPLVSTPAVDLAGKPVTLGQLEGRWTALIVANRDNADNARVMGQDLAFTLSEDRNVAVISVMDLKGIPNFARGLATHIILDKVAAADVLMKERFQKAGRPYRPGLTLYIPDWEGKLILTLFKDSPRPEFAVFAQNPAQLTRFNQNRVEREQQSLRNHIHVFILDRQGEVVAHYLDQGATPLVLNTLRELLRQDTAKAS
ncbi:hypothetical protein [Anthocerotibacter panamensis]|uniref:hypothetical protein n=1 Tax=Anthocerotibacter panamensis TaxID=2857077 RepID=UPI001C406E33|nr:hypothetical protein [Anthocerotibacter panamensis]